MSATPRRRWPAKRPHVYTDVLRYSGGQWQRQLQTPIGSDPEGPYEDRLGMAHSPGRRSTPRTWRPERRRPRNRASAADIANLAAYYETLK